MPTYEYRCGSCGEVFEHHESVAEHETMKPKCPKCRNEKVTRAYSRFYVKTAKKS